MTWPLRGIGLIALILGASTLEAHVASNGFLNLAVEGSRIHGSIELAVRDAEQAVGVDTNHDGRITWGELRAAELPLQRYLEQHLRLTASARACPLRWGALQVNARVDGNYAWFALTAQCPVAVRVLEVDYDVLAGIDPSHRGLLKLSAGSVTQTAVLGTSVKASFESGASGGWRAFREYFVAGVGHIWSGIDHLLFLLSLLLPAVLVRRQGRWEALDAARPAFIGILKVVTAFTVAHSITLTLAALDWVRLPSRLTESVIAASIIVAAVNNLVPVVTEGRARIAFAFGLLHGFGFASVLSNMGLPTGARLVSLVAFNLGIEAGQLVVVAAVMPLAYAARRARGYRLAFLPVGSAAIALVALVWFLQRAFLMS